MKQMETLEKHLFRLYNFKRKDQSDRKGGKKHVEY